MSPKSSLKRAQSPRHRAQPTPKKLAAKGVASLNEIARFVRRARAKGLKIVTTNGCFDIVHVGHIRYLTWAKKQGDILIVGINSDESVRRNKGPSRPINRERERAEVVAALKPVDAVFIFDEATPLRFLKVLKPDVHVKGADRTMNEIIERHVVKQGGGRILLAPHIKGRSTTLLIKQLNK